MTRLRSLRMLVRLWPLWRHIDPEFGGGALMDRLWAGWRSTYIEEVTSSDDAAAGDVFTRILQSGLPDEETHIVWRGELTFAILNRYPYISGHVLVMPYREVGELEDLPRPSTRSCGRR